MADDIRKGDKSPTVDNTEDGSIRRPRQRGPKHDFPKTQAGKMWDALGNPDEPINTMPGGMVNTAGGRPAAVTWRDAFRFSAFSKRDLDFYRTQCARDSLLVGIGAGGGIGGLRVILKGWSPLCSIYTDTSSPEKASLPLDDLLTSPLAHSYWPRRVTIGGVTSEDKKKRKVWQWL